MPARIFEVKGLEAKKRALAAESEVYRQTLRLEAQNLRLYSIRLQRKLTSFSPANTLKFVLPLAGLVFGRSMAGGLFRGFRFPWRGRLPMALLFAWQLWRRFGPLARQLVGHFRHRETAPEDAVEEEERVRRF